MTLSSIERNDVDAAVRFYRNNLSKGLLKPTDVQSLMMLQDDPSVLSARIAELLMDPALRRAFDAMNQRASNARLWKGSVW